MFIVIYTIEFQQRGLSYAHILIDFEKDSKIVSAEQIDDIISAKIPNTSKDLVAHSIVKKFFIHGPYGSCPKSVGYLQNDKYNKHFPKKFQKQIDIGEDRFSIYRRKDTSLTAKGKGIVLDNHYIV